MLSSFLTSSVFGEPGFTAAAPAPAPATAAAALTGVVAAGAAGVTTAGMAAAGVTAPGVITFPAGVATALTPALESGFAAGLAAA